MTRQSEETAVAIARLTQEGFECKDRDPETAIEKFQLAYQKSRLIEDDDTERTCAFNLGAAYVGQSMAKEGLKYLHKATPLENECDDSSSGDLFFNMGIAFEQLGEDSNALKYYEKAHEEFQVKGGSNLALEMHCLQKCLNLQQKLKKFADSAKVYKQMAAVSCAKKDYLGQADFLCKTAIQYQRAKQHDKANAAAMESINVFREFTPEGKECFASARVLNELGLLYTQIQSYAEALQCFERALEYVSTGNGDDPQLQVVIKQNLGAAYNFLGDFQRAIKFHEEAVEHYSKLNYRNGQGQCFTNLAFALSQLVPPDLKNAEIAFHQARQASLDTGDNNMRWQVLEGLGAVNFNQHCFEDAIRFFQDALQWVGQNKAASDRIKAKLRLVTEYNFNQRKAGVPLQYTGKPDMMVTAERSPRLGVIKEGIIIPQQMVPMTTEMPMMSRSEEEDPEASDSPPQRRFIGIRKRDSFAPHLPKVARGLTSMSMESRGSVSARSVTKGLQIEESEPESSSGSSSSEESSEEEESKSTTSSSSEDKNGNARIQSEKVEEIFSPKRTAAQPLSKAPTYGEPKYENVRQGAVDPAEQYQQALREKEAREADEESESDSDSQSSEEESSEEETSEEEEEADQRQVAGPPPVPTQSPPHTTAVNTQDLATYQISQARHNAPYISGSSGRVRNSAGFEDPQQTTSKSTEDDDNPYAVIDQTARSQFQPTVEGNSISNEQSITHHPQKRVAHKRTRQRSANFFESDDEARPDEQEGQPDQSGDMSDKGDHEDSDVGGPGQTEPRGQQEMRLFQEHQRLRQEQEGPTLPPRGNEKPSKTCVVM